MGMFDSVYLEIKCPFCKESEIRECQTKQLDCVLNVFYEHDYIETDLKIIKCIADCKSDKCGTIEYVLKNYKVIRGKQFDVKIFLKDKRVTGKYEII